MNTIDKILVAGILIIIFISIINILSEAYRIYVRFSFRSYFHMEPPAHCHIYKQRTFSNQYTLILPRWRHALPDGTRNLKPFHNRLIMGNCTLCIDNFVIKTKNPITMIHLVNMLRQNDFSIEQSVLEKEKEQSVLIERRLEQSAGSIDSIVDMFAENPQGFREYCMEIYLAMGTKAELSTPSGNGKPDIILTYENGETAIARCKCCQSNQAIGISFIQKLIDYNQTAGAAHMIFITTGRFTSPALELAEKYGVMLVDGPRLLGMIQTYLGTDDEEEPIALGMEDWILSTEDLRQYIPDDIWGLIS